MEACPSFSAAETKTVRCLAAVLSGRFFARIGPITPRNASLLRRCAPIIRRNSSMLTQRNRNEERTGIQDSRPYDPRYDLQPDFVMVYGIDD